MSLRSATRSSEIGVITSEAGSVVKGAENHVSRLATLRNVEIRGGCTGMGVWLGALRHELAILRRRSR